MQIDEPPENVTRLSESVGFRRASRIVAGLIAGGFGFATYYAFQAIREDLAGSASILHPPHSAVHAMGTGLFSGLCMLYFAWSAVTGNAWESDGADLD